MDIKAIRKALGGHPVSNVFKGILRDVVGLGVIIIASAAYVFATQTHGNILTGLALFVTMMGSLLWCVLVIVYLGWMLAALISKGCFMAALTAVLNNELAVGYVIRNRVCGGIAVVDEAGRKININGQTYSFDDVKNVQFTSGKQHYIEIILNKGADPVKKIKLESAQQTKTMFNRLGNSLKFS